MNIFSWNVSFNLFNNFYPSFLHLFNNFVKECCIFFQLCSHIFFNLLTTWLEVVICISIFISWLISFDSFLFPSLHSFSNNSIDFFRRFLLFSFWVLLIFFSKCFKLFIFVFLTFSFNFSNSLFTVSFVLALNFIIIDASSKCSCFLTSKNYNYFRSASCFDKSIT